MDLTDEEFRVRLHVVLERSGLSRRRLSQALGRDVGYVAALLDPTRPSRARPTPTDLLSASDATGIPFVELLEVLWGIDRDRLAKELGVLRGESNQAPQTGLSTDERAEVADFIAFLRQRHERRPDRVAGRRQKGSPGDRSEN